MTNNINAQNLELPLNSSQKQQVERIISDYLRTHPEIIVDAIEALRNRERQSQKTRVENNLKSSRQQLINDKTSPVGGNPNGDVTIVEFFDYRCGYCKNVFNFIPTLLKQDSSIRYVFKELPILSPESEMAARAALVVWKHQKKKYFKFHSDLMKSQGSLSERQIFRIAEKNGIEVAHVRKEINSDEISNILQRNRELAQKLGIRGTPAFVIGDRIIPGAIDLKTIKGLIAKFRRID